MNPPEGRVEQRESTSCWWCHALAYGLEKLWFGSEGEISDTSTLRGEESFKTGFRGAESVCVQFAGIH